MPGVFRPYSLADVLGTINDQSLDTSQGGDTVSGLGFFAEADEAATVGDSAAATVLLLPGWDQGTWGAMTWA